MENRMRWVAAGILVCFGTAGAWAAGAPSAAGAPQGQTAPAAGAQTTPQSGVNPEAPDHARAYYHYMLARRFKELAALYNRGDYIDKAVSEYKQAMEADPDSLFLPTELAELYWRIGRATEAIQEAEGVFDVAGVFAGMFILAVFVVIIDWIVTLVERRLLVWRPVASETRTA